MTDLTWNLVLGVVDGGALAASWRTRPKVVLAVGSATLALELTAARALSSDVFALLRLAAWVSFVHAPLVGLAIAARVRRDERRLAWVLTILSLVVVAVGIDAFLVEPRWLEVTHVRLTTRKLARPLRVAVLADVQTDHFGAWERSAMRRTLEEKPDVILFAGDYTQGATPAEDRDARLAFRRALAELDVNAPLGVYAVRGNVDSGGWSEIFRGNAATAFEETRSVAHGEIQVTGLSWEDSYDPSLLVPPADRFHIVLGHAPDFAMGAIAADLLVAGHTHGGQVRVPIVGPLITFSGVPRSWAAGATWLPSGATLVVSRGIGMERGHAPRMRFFCRPELAIIDVVPEGNP